MLTTEKTPGTPSRILNGHPPRKPDLENQPEALPNIEPPGRERPMPHASQKRWIVGDLFMDRTSDGGLRVYNPRTRKEETIPEVYKEIFHDGALPPHYREWAYVEGGIPLQVANVLKFAALENSEY